MGNYLKPLLGKIITVRELLKEINGGKINTATAGPILYGLQIITYPDEAQDWKGGQAIIEAITFDTTPGYRCSNIDGTIYGDKSKKLLLVKSLVSDHTTELAFDTNIYIPKILHYYPVSDNILSHL